MTHKAAPLDRTATPRRKEKPRPKRRGVAGGAEGLPGAIWGWPDKEMANPTVEGLSPGDLTGEDLAVLGLSAGREALKESLAAGVEAPVLKRGRLGFIKAVAKPKRSD